MKIIICMKQVPDTTEVRINPVNNTLIREGVESIVNPFDMYAIEEAIRLKEKHGGSATVVSMGPPQVETALREAIGLGVDEAVLLTDASFAGADTLATGYTLAAGIKYLDGADVILMGKQAMDGDTGQVGPEVAEVLGIAHITDIRMIEEIDDDGYITVERLLEDGYARLRTKLPVVLTVVKEINEPRLPSLKGKMAARKKEIQKIPASELDVFSDRIGLDGSPTQVMKIFAPPKPSGGMKLEGDAPDTVARLILELKKVGILSNQSREDK